MPGFTSQICSANLLGLGGMFEFTNDDGRFVRTNCGQAAAATLLTHYGKFPADAASHAMSVLEASHPPDQIGGLFGTSRRRVIQMCRTFGLRVKEVCGETGLRHELTARLPVIVMLGVSGGQFLGYNLPGGHWMVAYAFDEENVYLTNWGAMPWSDFRAGWAGLVPRLIQMRNRGLVAERVHTAS